MTISRFDPFEDRLCRDIRNELSEAFMDTLVQLSLEPVKKTAEKYLARGLAPVYQEYIEDRLVRYARAVDIIREEKMEEPFARALVLWDLGLFFEVHELLEGEWLAASGVHKLVLQAMIRAAGVYIQLEHGNTKGARKMAEKAVETLTRQRDAVPPIFDLGLLLAKLRKVDPVPPKLFSRE